VGIDLKRRRKSPGWFGSKQTIGLRPEFSQLYFSLEGTLSLPRMCRLDGLVQKYFRSRVEWMAFTRNFRRMLMLENIRQDLRYGVRMLRKTPGFTIVAVLTLVLGIGANTAIFSVLDPLLLRNLPVSHPDELVRLDAAGSMSNAGAWEHSAFEHFRDHSPVFSGVLAFVPVPLDDVTFNGRLRSAQGEVVSENYFNVLGVRPFAGKLVFQREELGNVAILGFDYWQSEFNGDKAALGKTIIVKGTPHTVVGITPPEFFGMRVGEAADLYLPASPERALDHPNGLTLDWVTLIGRLKPGMSSTQALSALQPAFEQVKAESQIPAIEQRQAMDQLVLTSAARGLSALRHRFSLPGRILMCVVGLVLLIACSNGANLLLAQGAARKREITVRLALGAGRLRLVCQLLTESAILGSVSALGGILVAQWASRLLVVALSDAQTHVTLATGLSLKLLFFLLATTVLAVVLCGLVPALSTTHVDITQDMKLHADVSHGARTRFGSVLVVGQVALSVTVLIGGGLLLRSLLRLETMDVGFDRDHVIALDINGVAAGHTPEQIKNFYDRLLESVSVLPGVRSATLSSFAPLSGRVVGVNVRAEGSASSSGKDTHVFLIGVRPGYFSTLGIELLQGQDFSLQSSLGSPPVAIINRSLGRHHFGDQNPVGRRLETIEGNRSLQIVGVVADSKYNNLREDTTDFLYLPAL
jgi:predicted permease